MLGFVGFVALGFTVIGIIAGGVIGGVIGGYAGKRIKKKIKRNKNLTHFDLFMLSNSCFLKYLELEILKTKKKKKTSVNINDFRYIFQKSLREFKPIKFLAEFPSD